MRWRVCVGSSICVLMTVVASAQEAHYWTEQYGNRARLLGGAVVGSAMDLSAVYYNPGALALLEDPELLLAGNVFQVRNTLLEDVLGGRGASQWSARLAPSLFAGEIRPGGDDRNRFAYSFLTRQAAGTRLTARLAETGEAFPGTSLSFVTDELRIDRDLNEYWAGGTWARELGEQSGVGVSAFFAYRSHRSRVQNFAQGLTTDGRALVAIDGREFSYWNWRVLWKLGYSTRFREWQVGVALTTPSLSIAGSGETIYDSTLVGEFSDAQGNPLTQIASDSQSHGATYRSPLSISGGGARQLGDTRVHLSAEWFDGEPPFTIVASEPFAAQSSGELIDTAIVSGRSSVFDFGFGVEHHLSDVFELYGGFATDFEAGVEGFPDVNDVRSGLDLYHFSGGAVFDLNGSDVTLGGVLAYGRTQLEDELVRAERTTNAELRFLRLTFIVGFNFQL